MVSCIVESLRVGFRIPFDRRPPYLSGFSLPDSVSLQPIDIVALIEELQVLLQKEAVATASQSPGFYNSFFLIQKVSGSWHPIIDFSP